MQICCHSAFSLLLETQLYFKFDIIGPCQISEVIHMWILWNVEIALTNSQLFIAQNWRLFETNIAVYSELFSTTTGLKWFNNKSVHCINKTDCCTLALTFLLSLLLSDSSSRGLSDGGVWGCLQSQGAEGGSSGWDGAMGWHPHSPPCAGTQPQDLGFSQRAARVGSDLTYSSLILLFWTCR